jgi:hypothetical protein
MPLLSSALTVGLMEMRGVSAVPKRATTAFRVARWVVSSVSMAVSRLPVSLVGLCIRMGSGQAVGHNY